MKPLLSVRGLEASYGDLKVLRGLDFMIAEGGVTALLGANGAGKTTTLRALCGMIARSGEIEFDGRPISRARTEDIVRLGIAHVPEGRGTFFNLTVEENLELGAMSRAASRGIAEDVARIYGYFPRLKERSRQRAGSLSGGEQQMLAIGRALMSKPSLLMLDEPSLGLAPVLVERIGDILREIQAAEGLAVLLAEQNATWALSLATRGVILDVGRIRMTGDAAQLLDNPDVRKAYLGV